MPILDAERLNRFMNEPRWTPAQYEEAEDVLAALENKLARWLGTHITPVPWTEVVAVLDSGLVNTTWHVHAVTNLDGVAVPEGAPPPSGWTISGHWLRRASTLDSVAPTPSSAISWQSWNGDLSGRADGQGRVFVSYLAGLGPLPELRLTILNKAKAVMDNRYSDAVTARGLDTTQLPALPGEEFTPEELAPLGNLRNITTWR